MHDTLQKEIASYEKRTPKSAAAHKRALNAFRSESPAIIVTTSPIPFS